MSKYHVNNLIGDDSWDGLAETYVSGTNGPWKTLGRVELGPDGLGGSYSSADEVSLARGCVFREDLAFPDSGAAGAGYEITLSCHGDESLPLPIIAGADLCEGMVGGPEKLTNGSLEWAGGVITGWTKTVLGGTSSVDQESADVYHGNDAVKLNIDSSGNLAFITHTAGITITDKNKKFRISLKHKEPESTAGSPAYLAIMIWRTNTVDADEYLAMDGTWSGTWIYGVPVDYVDAWKTDYIDFDTGPNPLNRNTYYVRLTPFKPAGDPYPPNSHTFWLDAVCLGRAATHALELLKDPEFRDFEAGTFQNGWTPFNSGSSEVKQTWPDGYGNKGLMLELDDAVSDAGVKQTVVLKASTTYRFRIYHREDEGIAGVTYQPKIEVKIKRDAATPEWWDGGSNSWELTESVALAAHREEYAIDWEEFATPAGVDQTYEITIHREAASSYNYMRLMVWRASLAEKDDENEPYHGFFPDDGLLPALEPLRYVYLTGLMGGVPLVDRLLMRETDSTVNPPRGCFYWDRSGGVLYVNVGEDPIGCDVECSVRERNLDFNGQSHLTAKDLVCDKAWYINIDLSYAENAAPRPQRLTLTRCEAHNAGIAGIIAGYRPPHPEDGGYELPHDKKTPGTLLIQDCLVTYYNRRRIIKVAFTSPPPESLPIPWVSGLKVAAPGIQIFPGADAGEATSTEVGSVYLLRNKVIADFPPLNESTGRNGITPMIGSDVLVQENLVVGAEHGIVVNGENSSGCVLAFEVSYNCIHHTGDDGIWIWGNNRLGNKVCYNLLHDNPDNSIDINDAAYVEVYGNTMAECRNEMVAIWGAITPLSAGCAFVYNNIFYNWGGLWRTGAPGWSKRLGCAIGFNGTVTKELSTIDHNRYYCDPARSTASKPFHVFQAQKTLAEWRAYGFDLHAKEEDPRFMDPENGDFRLRHDSPCIGAAPRLTDVIAYFGWPTPNPSRIPFDAAGASPRALDPHSTWPNGVRKVNMDALAEGTKWDFGCFGYVTESHLVAFRDRGTPKTGLAPTFKAFITNGGDDRTAPDIKEIKEGLYAFSTRALEDLAAIVDAGDSAMHDADRYVYLTIRPRTVLLDKLHELRPELAQRIAGADDLETVEGAVIYLTTDGMIPLKGVILTKLDPMIENVGGYRFTQKAMETGPVANVSGLSTHSAADAGAAAAAAMLVTPANKIAVNASNQVATQASGDAQAIKQVTDKLDTALVLNGAAYRFTQEALALGPTAKDFTSDQFTALKAILGVPDSGSAPVPPTAGGLKTVIDKTNYIPSAAIPSKAEMDAKVDAAQAALKAEVDANEALLVAIKGKTDHQPDAAMGSLAEIVAAIGAAHTSTKSYLKAEVDENQALLTTLTAKAASLPDAPGVVATLAALQSTVGAAQAAIVNEVDANEGKLDTALGKLQAIPGSGTLPNQAALDASLAAVQGALKTEIDANEALLGALQSTLALVKTQTDKMPLVKAATDLIAGIQAKTVNLPAAPADQAQLDVTLAAIVATLNPVGVKIGNYPATIPSATDLSSAHAATQAAIGALITALDGKVDLISNALAKAVGSVYNNSWRHSRVYVSGRVVSEKLYAYDTAANAALKGEVQGVVLKQTIAYTYKAGTDKVDDILILEE